MTRILLFLGLCLQAGIAVCSVAEDFTFTVIPSSPTSALPIRLQVDVESGSCYRLPTFLETTRPGDNIVQFEILIDDTCAPNLPSQQEVYNVGPFAAGQYVFRYALCGVTMSGYTCTILHSTPIVVGLHAAPQPSVVPSNGIVSAALLLVLIVAFGALRLRGR